MLNESLKNILISILSLGTIGFLAGVLLSYASKKFAVKIDPRIEEILRGLPGANCGACGFSGCRGFAEALLSGKAQLSFCRLIPEAQRKEIARILGIEAEKVEEKFAVIRCGAKEGFCEKRFEYSGIKTCKAENQLNGGSLSCEYGCLTWGDCANVCPFGAIKKVPGYPPIIDKDKCTGCGKCISACPRNLITLVPRKQKVYVLCNTQDKGIDTKKKCKVGCIACRICVKKCPNQAIIMEGRIPIINPEICLLAEECIKSCPQKTISRI